MKLSVILLSYKFKEYIKQSIDSVLNQKTNFDFELLVRDDFSNDGTEEVIKETIKSNTNKKVTIRHFLSTENWGGFNNLKFLLDNCKGEYISYLDGDDFFHDMSKLQHQVDFLENNLEYSLHSTSCFNLNKFGELLDSNYDHIYPLQEVVKNEDLVNKNLILSSSRMFRNVPNIIQDWMKNVKFIDWVMNYNITKYGDAYCDANFISTSYRNTGDGYITSLSDQQINNECDFIRDLLRKDYQKLSENKNKFWGYPNQLLPFNGDRFVEKEFLKLKKEYNIINAVETGSYMFSTTLWLSKNFNKVYTFEECEEFYNHGVLEVIDKANNVESFRLDSSIGVGQIISKIEGNTIFFLDAHGYDYCPLLDELKSISKFDYTPIIVIHDFKTPHSHLGYDSYNGIDFTIDYIAESLKKIYPDGYDYYYNYEAIGNAQRGLIYITPKKKKSDLIIIDSFISNSEIEQKTFNQIDLFRSNGNDVLLVSNSIPSNRLLKICDYFILDNRNQLFNSKYEDIEYVDFFRSYGNIVIHNFRPGLQRHGLSVLINLHNSVNYAKSLGYQNFLRVESDDIFGVESFKFIKSSNHLILESGKKALLFYNQNQNKPNLSFHYLYFNIDYYLEKILQLKNEQDYINYLNQYSGNNNFQIAEEYLYNCLKINGDDDVLIFDGSKFDSHFPDTIWNTTSSLSNLNSNYEEAITSIYKLKNEPDKFVVFSSNYTDKQIVRKIKVNFDDRTEEIVHDLLSNGYWVYHFYDMKIKSIDVFDKTNDTFLYTEKNENILNYVEFS